MVREKKHVSFASLVGAFRRYFDEVDDERHNGKVHYKLADVVLSGFACMFFQDPSLLQFQKRMQDKDQLSNLNTLFGVSEVPESTQLRDVLDALPSDIFAPLFKQYFSRLQRGKHLETFQFLKGQYLVSIDGTQYFSSTNISCPHCLTKQHAQGETTYCHHALQGALMHPDLKQVIPLMAEDIRNEDGKKKQDCETNAAKRFIEKLRTAHPHLGIILLGDGLFSHQPMIEAVMHRSMHYIFVAKPDDHKYMMEWIGDSQDEVRELKVTDSKGRLFVYQWLNDVPLCAREDAFSVNYFQLQIFSSDDNGERTLSYKNSWVTDLELSEQNIQEMVKGARCRWKIENECFNTLKNQGYHLEHNFGHGDQFLSFNFYLLTLLAFLYHQIMELTDHLFQEARKRWSKRYLWEQLRSAIKLILFTSWRQLLAHCLDPPRIYSTAPT